MSDMSDIPARAQESPNPDPDPDAFDTYDPDAGFPVPAGPIAPAPPVRLSALSRRFQGQKFRSAAEKTAAQVRFLEALAEFGTVAAACRDSLVHRSTVYGDAKQPGWLMDPDFKAQFDIAMRIGTEVLEEVARDRAVNGVITSRRWKWDRNAWPEDVPEDDPRRNGAIDPATGKPYRPPGALICSEETRTYSDGLLTLLLKKRDPAFRDRMDVTSGGAPMKALVGVDLNRMASGE